LGAKEIDTGRRKQAARLVYINIFQTGPARPATSARSLLPQIRKHALIVDVRGNGGALSSPIVIERLRRALVMIDSTRNGMQQNRPSQTFTGPMEH